MTTPQNYTKPVQTTMKPRTARRVTILLLASIITVILMLAALATPTPAGAKNRHHHRVCTGHPMPRSVCSLILHEAKFVPGAKASWATNRDLAIVLKRESGFDFCASNPGRHTCGYPGRHHSCGLFQKLPCVRRVWYSRVLQTRDGLRYIVSRYHAHPREAKAHSDKWGWY